MDYWKKKKGRVEEQIRDGVCLPSIFDMWHLWLQQTGKSLRSEDVKSNYSKFETKVVCRHLSFAASSRVKRTPELWIIPLAYIGNTSYLPWPEPVLLSARSEPANWLTCTP